LGGEAPAPPPQARLLQRFDCRQHAVGDIREVYRYPIGAVDCGATALDMQHSIAIAYDLDRVVNPVGLGQRSHRLNVQLLNRGHGILIVPIRERNSEGEPVGAVHFRGMKHLEVSATRLTAKLRHKVRLVGCETLLRCHDINLLRFIILDKPLARLISGGPPPRHPKMFLSTKEFAHLDFDTKVGTFT